MSSLKNMLIIFLCIACAGFAYYVTRSDSSSVEMTNSAVRQELIAKTQSFIERSTRLQQINIDQSFFMDSTFTSLRSFSTPVPNQALGRDDLFGAQANIGTSVSPDVVE